MAYFELYIRILLSLCQFSQDIDLLESNLICHSLPSVDRANVSSRAFRHRNSLWVNNCVICILDYEKSNIVI
jgi:hypothetical protein